MYETIKGFLPWILFSILISAAPIYSHFAAPLALITTLVMDYKFLQQKFIFSWATLLFFLALTLNNFLFKQSWIINNANLLANAMLALIAWLSLVIGQPFTLQYARQQVAKVYWRSKLFLRTNQLLTAVWSVALTISTVGSILPLYYPQLNNLVLQIILYAPLVFAVIFTRHFPTWYTEKFWRTLRVVATDVNPGLTGNLTPVTEERDITELEIVGEIPLALSGIYMRNGPNPLYPPISYTYPFDGDGMIHAIYLTKGQARYRNRFIETQHLIAERRAGHALYGGINRPVMPDPKFVTDAINNTPIKQGCFIHIIRHAGRYIALHESTTAYELTAELQTLGLWNPDTTAPIAVNAHTRVDAITGELFAFTYHLDDPDISPYLTAYVLDAKGQLQRRLSIQKTYATMLHDFVVTQNYLVFFDNPVMIDRAGSIQGKPIFNWQPELGSRIGIASKTDEKAVFWLETDAFFNYHFANAYETADEIIVDYVRYAYFTLLPQDTPPATLHRLRINLAERTLTDVALDQQNIEFPRINPNYETRAHQFIYALTHQLTENRNIDEFNTLLKYDVIKQTYLSYYFGENIEIGEPVFAPRPNDKQEDGGYLLLFAYDKTTQLSECIILAAEQLTLLARLKLLCRVPGGLHGSWMPEVS